MKLGYMMLLVAVGAMLVIAPSVIAADKPAKAHGDKSAIYGKVAAVDTKATPNTITIKVQGKKDAPAQPDKTITVAADATISIPGKDKPTLADVQSGDHVAVTLNADGTAATKIVVMPPREKKAK